MAICVLKGKDCSGWRAPPCFGPWARAEVSATAAASFIAAFAWAGAASAEASAATASTLAVAASGSTEAATAAACSLHRMEKPWVLGSCQAATQALAFDH